jgi:hypothetical protein
MEKSDTKELLRECNAGVKMGVDAIDGVLPTVRSENLRRILKESKNVHSRLGSEAHRLLNVRGVSGKAPHPMARSMSKWKTNMKLTFSPTDRAVAELITDGCNMGVKSLAHYLNRHASAVPEAKSIADNLIREELNLAEQVRQYL